MSPLPPPRRARAFAVLVGVLAVVLIVAAAMASLRTFVTTRTARHWVDHTQQVVVAIASTRIHLLQAVLDVRTGLLTSSAAEREPLEVAEEAVDRDLTLLTELTRDNPQQQERLGRLRGIVRERLALCHRQLQESTPTAVAQMAQGTVFDMRIGDLFETMRRNEEQLLTERDQTYAHSRVRTEGLLLLTAGLAVLGTLISVPVLLKQMRLRAQAEQSLLEANHGLEEQVATRTRELVDSRERLALAMRVGGIGTYDWQLDQDRLVWSPELEQLYGLREGAFDGRYATFQAFVVPEDLPAVEQAVAEAVRTGGGIDREFRIRRQDGQLRWIRSIGQVVPGRRFIGVNIDTTEARAAHEAVRASEHRYRFLAESMPEIVWTASPDGRIDYVNQVYSVITGRPAQAIHGRVWTEDVHPEDREGATARWHAALRTGEAYVSEHRLRRADGAWRWQLVRAHPLRAGDGAIQQWVGTSTDIEDQRRRAAELERQVQVRTRALRVANEELESFSYSVSHDLRAPLRAVEGFASALAEDHGDRLPSEGLHQLARVRAAASRMASIIDALLGLARTGRGDLHVTSVDCAAMAQAVLTELREHEPGRVVEAHLEPCVLQADPALMRTLFENLIGNAWKFTRGRNPARIRVACAPAQPGWVSLTISDNGAGFDPAHAGSMFQPFRRFHDAAAFPGSGIGLATVRRIVERHGGTIAAEGTPDQGAVFHITLPAAPETT